MSLVEKAGKLAKRYSKRAEEYKILADFCNGEEKVIYREIDQPTKKTMNELCKKLREDPSLRFLLNRGYVEFQGRKYSNVKIDGSNLILVETGKGPFSEKSIEKNGIEIYDSKSMEHVWIYKGSKFEWGSHDFTLILQLSRKGLNRYQALGNYAVLASLMPYLKKAA